MPVAAPSPGLIPHASLRVPNLSERGPDGRKHFFGSPEDGPPKQVLASGPYALRSRKGAAGMGSARNLKEQDNGIRQKQPEESTATRNHTPGTDRLAFSERGEKKFWNRIRAAWEHEDGEGLTLQLDLIPVAGGRIVLRVPKQEEEGA
jgi:hypothetical protein